MSPDDVVLVFRFWNEDAYINRFLENNLRLCKCFIALDDRSDCSCVFDKLIHNSKCAAVIRKNIKLTNLNEPCDREVLYSLAFTTGCKYIMYLDVDEIMEKTFLDEMATLPPADRYVADIISLTGPNRMMIPRMGTRQKIGFISCLDQFRRHFRGPENVLHTPRLPKKEHELVHAVNSRIYHFNMTSQARRERRHKFYRMADPYDKWQKMGYDYILEQQREAPVEVNIYGSQDNPDYSVHEQAQFSPSNTAPVDVPDVQELPSGDS